MMSLHIVLILVYFATGDRIVMRRGCRAAALFLVICAAIIVGWVVWRVANYRIPPNGPGVSQDYIEEHGLPKDFNTRRYVLP